MKLIERKPRGVFVDNLVPYVFSRGSAAFGKDLQCK